MCENGIDHHRITPFWPQANSEAEGFMKPLIKTIRSAHVESKTWTKHLHRFLLNYRTTPHSMTGFAPAELLFNRKIRNKLPHIPSDTLITSQSHVEAKVKENDDGAKVKMKTYANANVRAKTSSVKIGDTMLARQQKYNKLSTLFDPSPFCVVRTKGTMIAACRNGKYITRNTSHFKVVDPIV